MILPLVTEELGSEPHMNLLALAINALIKRDPQGLWNKMI